MKRIVAVTLVLALTFGAGTAAMAAWRATGVGTAAASAGSLAQPAAPSAGRQASSPITVDLAWTAVPTATSYVVHRFSDETSTTGGVQVCSLAATSCQDTAAPTSAMWYRVTATRGTWSSPVSASAPVASVVDVTGPEITVTHPEQGREYGRARWPGLFTGTASPTGSAVVGVEIALRATSGGSSRDKCWNAAGTGFTAPCDAPALFRAASVAGPVWELPFSNFTNGNQSYEAVIRATDEMGNVTTTETISFNVHGS